ncbi:MAG: hypothetical protein RL441_1455, partial [Actinomycetota bacterium]
MLGNFGFVLPSLPTIITRARRLVTHVVVAALAVTAVLANTAPAQAVASGMLDAEFVFSYAGASRYSSAATPDQELPAGEIISGAVNYACLTSDCFAGEIVVTLPTSVVLSGLTYAATDVSA